MHRSCCLAKAMSCSVGRVLKSVQHVVHCVV